MNSAYYSIFMDYTWSIDQLYENNHIPIAQVRRASNRDIIGEVWLNTDNDFFVFFNEDGLQEEQSVEMDRLREKIDYVEKLKS